MKIQKKNLNDEVVFQYDGEVVAREGNAIILEAFFGRDDMAFLNVTLKRGDRFVETFYTDRWYNIFEIFDRDDKTFKGWYCNIGKPALIDEEVVSYIDLALDLWVAPDGTQIILDEDEFLELKLEDPLKRAAYAGLHELQKIFTEKYVNSYTKNPTS